MTGRSLLCTPARWFTTFTKARDQRTGSHLAHCSQLGLELITLLNESFEIGGKGHVSPDSIIRCQKMAANPSGKDFSVLSHFSVVRPPDGRMPII